MKNTEELKALVCKFLEDRIASCKEDEAYDWVNVTELQEDFKEDADLTEVLAKAYTKGKKDAYDEFLSLIQDQWAEWAEDIEKGA